MNTTLYELVEITVDIKAAKTDKEYSKQAARATKIREQIVKGEIQELIVNLSATFSQNSRIFTVLKKYSYPNLVQQL